MPLTPIASRPWNESADVGMSLGLNNGRPWIADPDIYQEWKKGPAGPSLLRLGGPEGNRTPDLFHAKEARSRCATGPDCATAPKHCTRASRRAAIATPQPAVPVSASA